MSDAPARGRKLGERRSAVPDDSAEFIAHLLPSTPRPVVRYKNAHVALGWPGIILLVMHAPYRWGDIHRYAGCLLAYPATMSFIDARPAAYRPYRNLYMLPHYYHPEPDTPRAARDLANHVSGVVVR